MFRVLIFVCIVAICAAFTGALRSSLNSKFTGRCKASGSSSTSIRATVIEKEAVVVGSGISGSTAAYYLDKEGVDVILTEARDVIGGNLITKTNEDGYLWEEGPNSFQPNPFILRFAKDVGIIDELVLADPTLPRFVFWEDRLFALPGGLTDLPFFNLLTWPAKIRAGLGALGFIADKPTDREESVKEFVTRHLGEQVFTRIIDPFVSGVYAGDPSSLSMQAALRKVNNLEALGANKGILSGAIVRINQLKEEKEANKARDADLPEIPGGSLGTFKRGLQSLPLAAAQCLGPDKVYTNHKLVHVAKDTTSKKWLSTFETNEGTVVYKSKSLLLTAPGYVTCDIVGGEDSVVPAAKELGDIEYPPVASVTIAYPNSAFKDGPPLRSGFGHLIPRAMKIRTLGTIWSSSLFPGRAPEGHTMLLNYIGGAQDKGIKDLSESEIVAQVHQDVKKILLKDSAEPPRVLGVRVWPRAIPQYNKGHLDILKRVDDENDAGETGLFLGGNYRTGVAFGDCVMYGTNVAQDIKTFLNTAQDTPVDVPVPS